MKVLIYTATDPAPVARALEQVERVQVCVAGDEARFREEIDSADALILGNARYQSVEGIIIEHGRRLRWIQFSSSGYDALRREALRSEIAITRAIGVWTPMVAEHALALSLALLRRLPDCEIAREGRRWENAAIGGRVGSFSGLRILVVGYGDVGKTFAALARSLGAEIIPVARSARVEDGVEVLGVQRSGRMAAAGRTRRIDGARRGALGRCSMRSAWRCCVLRPISSTSEEEA